MNKQEILEELVDAIHNRIQKELGRKPEGLLFFSTSKPIGILGEHSWSRIDIEGVSYSMVHSKDYSTAWTHFLSILLEKETNFSLEYLKNCLSKFEMPIPKPLTS